MLVIHFPKLKDLSMNVYQCMQYQGKRNTKTSAKKSHMAFLSLVICGSIVGKCRTGGKDSQLFYLQRGYFYQAMSHGS